MTREEMPTPTRKIARVTLVSKLDEMVSQISLQIAEKEMEKQAPKVTAR
jgi:hypothetical protein